jgi:glycosyltransferase involved in cell wall biosynthesis
MPYFKDCDNKFKMETSPVANDKPTVSICIPTFNGGALLEHTINSVLAQTNPDWELIVSDDHSTDGSYQRIKTIYENDSRFTFTINPQSAGAANNWNNCVKHAQGKYLKLLCQDDLINEDCLDISVRAMEKNPNVVLVTGPRAIIDQDGRTIIGSRGNQGLEKLVSGYDAVRMLTKKGTNIICEPSIVLYRTEAFTKTLGFDASWSYLIDVASYVEVLKHGDLYCVESVLGSFRISNLSWSSRLLSSQSKEFRRFVKEIAHEPNFEFGKLLILRSFTAITVNAVLRRMIFMFVRIKSTRQKVFAS